MSPLESTAIPPSPDDTAAPAAPAPVETRHPVEFSGEAGEYFRIWIVNTVLSLLTLGIYSAWAKVRTQRYFYGHTRIAGAAFDYSAQPLPILKGRLIGAALLGLYVLTAQFAPIWNLAVLVLLFALTPWVVVRGLAFRARYSAWRGLHFRFVGSYAESYKVFLGLMLLTPFTLGLLYPYAKGRQHQFIVNHHRFGGRAFSFTPPYPLYFAIYLGTFAVLMVGLFGVIFLVASLAFATGGEGSDASATGYATVGAIYLLYFCAFAFLQAVIANLLWNNARLGQLRFESTLSPVDLGVLYLTNAVAILATAGLMIPWAMVRTARYRARCLTLVASESLDSFVADSRVVESAIGAEIGDAFDVDIGL